MGPARRWMRVNLLGERSSISQRRHYEKPHTSLALPSKIAYSQWERYEFLGYQDLRNETSLSTVECLVQAPLWLTWHERSLLQL
jgi:hypothetical protein